MLYRYADKIPRTVKGCVDLDARLTIDDVTDFHGNSKQSQQLQHGYEIYETNTGDVVKTGISGQPLNKNGTSPRANRQVNALNKAAGKGKYASRISFPVR